MRENAFGAQQVLALLLQQRTHPLLELVLVDRSGNLETHAVHTLGMAVIIHLQEIRIEIEDAREIERADVQDFGH